MRMRRVEPGAMLLSIALGLTLGLTACSPVNVRPVASEPMAAEVHPDTTATTEISNGVVVDWLQVANKEGDLFALGNPNAPIRMTDYSDFL